MDERLRAVIHVPREARREVVYRGQNGFTVQYLPKLETTGSFLLPGQKSSRYGK